MANDRNWGGKREGGGRPSKFALEQKKVAATKRQAAVKKKIEDAQELVVDQMIAAAGEGKEWAVKWLAEHIFGRPTARQDAGDTDFVLKLAFDRKPAASPEEEVPAE